MKKGFSLVEVLVSLTIAGTLLTLSLPAFNVVRNKHLHAKYQSAIHTTSVGIQQIMQVYYKLGYEVNASNEPLSLENLDTFDLKNRTEAEWDAINTDELERFNVAPLEEGTKNFCTQFASVINTMPFDSGESFRCAAPYVGAQDLSFTTSSGIKFYGVNQPFPGGANNWIDINVILDDREWAESTLDETRFTIRIHPDGEIEPLTQKAKELTLVTYKIASVDARDETAIINKLIAMKGVSTEQATQMIKIHAPVEMLIPYDDYEADKTQLESATGSGREILIMHYFYKPKLTDFTL